MLLQHIYLLVQRDQQSRVCSRRRGVGGGDRGSDAQLGLAQRGLDRGGFLVPVPSALAGERRGDLLFGQLCC
ncbi:hypothetical protein [Actinacidiphila glaucinigra]|uniref:hypothetical protein n=1 Tax=Actinacidiphila glaucinigra TaxID=235986 RepID=UPI003D8C8BC5